MRIAVEYGTANPQNPQRDSSHQQSMCEITPIIFQISIREILSQPFSFRVMKKYNKNALMQISQVIDTL